MKSRYDLIEMLT